LPYDVCFVVATQTPTKQNKTKQNKTKRKFEIELPIVIHVESVQDKRIYYILTNEILRNIDEIKCVFSFSVFSL
jgi:hypothetical protein